MIKKLEVYKKYRSMNLDYDIIIEGLIKKVGGVFVRENKEEQLTIDEIDEQNMERTDYSMILKGNVIQNKSDIGFKTLVDGFNEFLYVIPRYQRKYVWSKGQVENLAISLIRGLPIPPIYVYRNNDGSLEIIDGQQRMLSLFLYYKGKYIKNGINTQVELQKIIESGDYNTCDFEELLNKVYPLKDVSYQMKYSTKNSSTNEYEDMPIEISYKILPKDIKRKLDYTPISVIEIKVDDNDERHKLLYKVFENLNDGGTILTKQELRNGIYSSPFYDMLHKVNENDKWRAIYGVKHKHSRDVELLLRFSAVAYYFKLEDEGFNISKYRGTYPLLLNDFSDNAINFALNKVENQELKLLGFIEKLNVNVKVQHTLLESLYLASLYIEGEYIIDDKLINNIQEDKRYENIVRKASTSRKSVKGRFDYVYKRLSEYVGNYQRENS